MSLYLIIGANRGIGLEMVRQLKERGEDVIATCRSSSPELDALSVRVESNIDITSGDSVIKLRENLKDTKVDVLIHNAGIAELNSLSNLDPQSILAFQWWDITLVIDLLYLLIDLIILNTLYKILFLSFNLNYSLPNVFLNFFTKLIPTPGIVKSSSSDAEIIDSGVI